MYHYLQPPAQFPGLDTNVSAELDGFGFHQDQDQTEHTTTTAMDHTDQTADDVDTGSSSRAVAMTLKPIRRRNRMINSCLECRKRKLTSPSCVNCLKAGRDCLYIGPRLDEASQLRLAELKEKQGSLERQLERDVAKSTSTKSAQQQRILADEVEDGSDDERDLEATPLVALDLTYEDDADGADDMIDLGIQIGKMRITERIGGLSRPRISEEVCVTNVQDQNNPRALTI
jgi:hypothetical protein